MSEQKKPGATPPPRRPAPTPGATPGPAPRPTRPPGATPAPAPRPAPTPRPAAPPPLPRSAGEGARPPAAPSPRKARPARAAQRPAPRPGPRTSTPAERAREDALFLEAGLEPTAASAAGKDPEAAAALIAQKHARAVVRLMGAAFARGEDGDLLAAHRLAARLHDKGAKLIDIFAKKQPRYDKALERCVRVVGTVAGKEVLERLRALAKDDPAPSVRAAAFEALARALDSDGLAKTAREVIASETEPPEIKAAALEALGEAKAIGAASLCALVIHDTSPDVRKAAARALTRMGPPAIPAILEDVRARGQQTIGLILDSVKAVVGATESVDLTALPADVVEQARKIFVGALRDSATPVRWAAAIALGMIGGQDEFAPLDEACTFEKNEVAKANMEQARAELKKRVSS